MHGFSGRVLHVDLTSGRSAHHDLEESRLRKYMGGIGLGTSLLHDYAPPGVDPLSPDNPLIFASRAPGRNRSHDDGEVRRRHQVAADRIHRGLALVEPLRPGAEAARHRRSGDHRPGAVLGLRVHPWRGGRDPSGRPAEGEDPGGDAIVHPLRRGVPGRVGGVHRQRRRESGPLRHHQQRGSPCRPGRRRRGDGVEEPEGHRAVRRSGHVGRGSSTGERDRRVAAAPQPRRGDRQVPARRDRRQPGGVQPSRHAAHAQLPAGDLRRGRRPERRIA